ALSAPPVKGVLRRTPRTRKRFFKKNEKRCALRLKPLILLALSHIFFAPFLPNFALSRLGHPESEGKSASHFD
ncbi:hypothetical protein, partial [Celeribacter sp.]|uniref:hypothetical protein n=1 Tax=Celeribacter sp. TaxID=1890673 RepID=UPI003A9269DB